MLETSQHNVYMYSIGKSDRMFPSGMDRIMEIIHVNYLFFHDNILIFLENIMTSSR